MRKVTRQTLQTNAEMFRYQNVNDSQQKHEKKEIEDNIVKNYASTFKIVEGIGALFSTSAMILVIIFWARTGFNLEKKSTFDAHRMKTSWTSLPAIDKDGVTSEWHDKYYRSRVAVKHWLTYSDSGHDSNIINALLNSYDDVPTYPATAYLYDVASVRQPYGPTASQPSLDSFVSITTPAPNAGNALYYQAVGSAVIPLSQSFKTSLNAQCMKDDKHSFDLSSHVVETWDDKSYIVIDTAMNVYSVNLWSILFFIYFFSGLFQAYRTYFYSTLFRPVGPDVSRWLAVLPLR